MRTFLAIFFLLIVAGVTIFGLRGSRSLKPPIEVFPDMDRQAKYHPQDVSGLFPDGRSDRPSVPGSVPHPTDFQRHYSHLLPKDRYYSDSYLATGTTGLDAKGQPLYGRGFPKQGTDGQPVLSEDRMARGRQMFNLYCAVCHGAAGDGQGITRAYGMNATANLHEERFRSMPEGEIFNTITNGKNTMLSYGPRIAPDDRWAIILYLRALQLSQNARVEDVPASQRAALGL